MEDTEKIAQYAYKANANLVLNSEKRPRDLGPTGEVQSLAESMTAREMRMMMGERAVTTHEQDTSLRDRIEKRRLAAAKKPDTSQRLIRKRANVLDAEVVGLYEPKTQDTRRAFSALMTTVSGIMSGQPHAVMQSACEEVLALVKSQEGGTGQAGLAQGQLKRDIADLLSASVDEETFRQIVSVAGRIHDFQQTSEVTDGMDEEMGVAVVFDEEEEEAGPTGDLSENEDFVEEEEQEVEEDGDEHVVETTLGRSETEAGVSHADLMQDETNPDIINPKAVDAFWLQRELSSFVTDPIEAQAKAESILSTLSQDKDTRIIENAVVGTLGFEHFAFVKRLMLNRDTIVWCTRLARAKNDDERRRIGDSMFAQPRLRGLLEALMHTKGTAADRGKELERSLLREVAALKKGTAGPTTEGGARDEWGGTTRRPVAMVDIDALAFTGGGHFMANTEWVLPKSAVKKDHKDYQEIFVPALAPDKAALSDLVKILTMPEWARPAFANYASLNPVQSRLYRSAMFSASNILLCAPTGAGKTNVAVLCILREIGLHLNKETGTVDVDAFKVVYVAPMKSLVREMVGTLSTRLSHFGVTVRELSGDQQLSREEIKDTQILVVTPEKWDIVTRKSGYAAIASLVSLIVIDEIHLLHDTRGPVLEAIISRTIREIEHSQELTRIVGLSATLPNYDDVAEMLRVDAKNGLFVFDNTFRPCPLQQVYIGVTAKRPFKQYQKLNELCWERVLQQAGKNQALVFVHSRKDTATTARFLRDQAQEHDKLALFVPPSSASMGILSEEAKSVTSQDLKDVLPMGFGIHHAGMTAADRGTVEDLFAEGHLKVLVSTATLAWGVNLPAHSVIIKGTQVYSPELGRWTELSMLDVMQMLGRAGRPQFDTYGEGTILTTHRELKYYLSLLNEQLPVESQLLSRLPDTLNAEIVLGTVRNAREASQWLTYTYLFVRMKSNPALYGVAPDSLKDDPLLEQRRLDLVHSAATILDRAGLVKYDRKSGTLASTDLGRIASHYYLSHRSMSAFGEYLKPTMSDIDMLRVFALSEEFKQIGIREEEKIELAKLLDKVPIPVKQTLDEPAAKVNILLQAYISRLTMEGFALVADLCYVTQSAGRLMRALFEICLRRKWADNAARALSLCQMIDHRMWSIESPLRQFRGNHRLPIDVIHKLEKTHLPWDALLDLEPHQLGELIRLPKLGKQVHRRIHQVPKLDAVATFQPITRTLLKVDLELRADFEYNVDVHGPSQAFWVLVEDQDSETILHHELFVLRAGFADHPHTISFTVSVSEPIAPQYFVRILSDRWLGSSTVVPLSFRHLILPDKFAPATELLDLQPLPVAELADPRHRAMYDFRHFNAIQTQAFPCLFESDDSALVAAPTGSGKTACAEFALFRMLNTFPQGRAVYIAPNASLCRSTLERWAVHFGDVCTIGQLSGDLATDLRVLSASQIVVSEPGHFDALSRKWRSRTAIQNFNLVIVDDAHFIGAQVGHVIEVCVSRVRFIASQLKRPIRIVVLSASMANAGDVAQWIGAHPRSTFAFSPAVRPVPLDIHLHGMEFHSQEDRQQAMVRPAYALWCRSFDERLDAQPQLIVFAPSRQQARRTALAMLSMAMSEMPVRSFLRGITADALKSTHLDGVQNAALREAMTSGIAFLHAGLSETEANTARTLFQAGALSVLVVDHELAYDLRSLRTDHVVILGTQYYDGQEKKLSHYSIVEVEAMVGCCGRQGQDTLGRVDIFCHRSRADFYSRFLLDAFPVESHLDQFLADHLNAEVVNRTICNVQEAVDYLTWTLLYRRLSRNPNYYNLRGTTHRHLSDYLSELIETSVEDLAAADMIATDDAGALSPLNLGMVAAHYYLRYQTIELFAQSLAGSTRLKGVLNIVSAASEFDALPVRQYEENVLERLAKHLRLQPPPSPDTQRVVYYDSHTKAHLLLQAHFSRIPLSAEVLTDLQTVLPEAIRLIQALVDVVASKGWLMPALQAMDLSQMVIQGVWADQNGAQLLQLPHVSSECLARCVDAGITTIDQLLDMDDDARVELLRMSTGDLQDVANVCNQLPNLSVDVAVVDAPEVSAGARATLAVRIEREHDEDDVVDGDVAVVHDVIAPLYPQKRIEGWWLVLGDVQHNRLVGIKKVALQKMSQTVKFDFIAPSAGSHRLCLYTVSDSYLGTDQQHEFDLDVAEGVASSDDDDGMDTD
ncbi:unnamed protein product (mitochondrion) [Plasmodiophora brassicae]|uniref:Uncharacterized protein n=1 Tax=Plasmodiophora brassicae TaxID=37360 RepID=A0A0G4J2Q4_PLABS|nr:hypothetical protein PBRA_008782 [Plasmodiophora brassicae]SPR01669.1 unnamed protein product [Plasmodiophora brassicae]